MGIRRLSIIGALLSVAFAGLSACDFGAPKNLCDGATDCYTVEAADLLPIDGDTFQYRGQRLRLIGWDSPESSPHANCPEEAELGAKTERVSWRIISDASSVEIKPVGRDEYDRLEAHIYVDGVDIGYLMRQEGLARRWSKGKPKPDWCR